VSEEKRCPNSRTEASSLQRCGVISERNSSVVPATGGAEFFGTVTAAAKPSRRTGLRRENHRKKAQPRFSRDRSKGSTGDGPGRKGRRLRNQRNGGTLWKKKKQIENRWCECCPKKRQRRRGLRGKQIPARRACGRRLSEERRATAARFGMRTRRKIERHET
jgi:hypothetical protein